MKLACREAARAFNGYNAGLRAMIRDVSGFADRVASGSTELAASANEMERAVAEIANVSETLKTAGERVNSAICPRTRAWWPATPVKASWKARRR